MKIHYSLGMRVIYEDGEMFLSEEDFKSHISYYFQYPVADFEHTVLGQEMKDTRIFVYDIDGTSEYFYKLQDVLYAVSALNKTEIEVRTDIFYGLMGRVLEIYSEEIQRMTLKKVKLNIGSAIRNLENDLDNEF